MNYHKPTLRRALLAAGALIATASPAVLCAAPANAASTVTFANGVLTINGDAGNNALVVGRLRRTSSPSTAAQSWAEPCRSPTCRSST